MITTQGLNDLLDTYLGARAKEAAFYVGLISGTGYTGVSASDTMASHAGWTEYTDYSETSRPAISFGASSSGDVTNPVVVSFTPNADASVAGFFITTVATKGGSTGRIPFAGVFSEGVQYVKTAETQQFVIDIAAINQLGS